MPREVFVIGGGPSLAGFDFQLLEGKDTIAVNQALFRIPSAKYFITMDYTWRTQLDTRKEQGHVQQFRKHKAHKIFVVGFSQPRLVVHDARTVEDTQFKLKYQLQEFNQVIFCNGYGGIGLSWDNFRVGSESGYAALQLAVLLKYERIILLGYDFCLMSGQTHFHEDYVARGRVDFARKLNEYYQPYPDAICQIQQTGIEVYSGSAISKLNQQLLFIDVESLCRASAL